MTGNLFSEQQRVAAATDHSAANAYDAGRGATVDDPELSVVHSLGHCALEVRPHLVLREIAQLVGRVVPPHISIQADVPEELWPIVGDPGEIHRALINVLINACAAMPAGGHLVLTAANVTVQEVPASPIFDAPPGDYVGVAVSDTGCGIDQMPLRLGVGLRLAHVARVLRNHRGFARIESRANQLTTVSLYFPRAENASGPSDSVAEPAERPAGSILVVDDDETILDLSRRILSLAGYKVFIARGGREALAIFGRCRSEIGLVLTDLAMPGLNGFTLVWALRRSKPDLRVMVATGHGSSDNLRELDRMGVRQVLLKPYTSQHLRDAVARALAEPVQCEPDLFIAGWASSGTFSADTFSDSGNP